MAVNFNKCIRTIPYLSSMVSKEIPTRLRYSFTYIVNSDEIRLTLERRLSQLKVGITHQDLLDVVFTGALVYGLENNVAGGLHIVKDTFQQYFSEMILTIASEDENVKNYIEQDIDNTHEIRHKYNEIPYMDRIFEVMYKDILKGTAKNIISGMGDIFKLRLSQILLANLAINRNFDLSVDRDIIYDTLMIILVENLGYSFHGNLDRMADMYIGQREIVL